MVGDRHILLGIHGDRFPRLMKKEVKHEGKRCDGCRYKGAAKMEDVWVVDGLMLRLVVGRRTSTERQRQSAVGRERRQEGAGPDTAL